MSYIPGANLSLTSQLAPMKPAVPVEPQAASEGMTFPSAILVKEIAKTNSRFNAEKYEKYRAMYKAGEFFKALQDEFLVKRALEKSGSSSDANLGGAKQYNERKERAYNIPRGSGLIDWMAAEGTKDHVKIAVDGEVKDATDPETGETLKVPTEAEYWFGLENNADGLGRDMTSIATTLVREAELFGRAYLYAYFPEEVGHTSDPDSLTAWMRVLPTDSVDDWEYKSNGQLDWIRVHSVTELRSAWYKQPDVDRHTWCYITDSKIVCYFADKKKGQQFKDEDEATILYEDEHDFERIPVFPVEVEDGINVMDRIYDVLKALYNREASITWALDQSAYAMLVFKLGRTDITEVYSSEVCAVKLLSDQNEDVDFKSPNPQIFDPLFKDCDRLRTALYEVLQATAITAATQTQNARQSASAKTLDMDLIQSLLRAYVVPVRNAMRSWVEAVSEYRKDKVEVELQGLDTISTTLEQLNELIGGAKGQSPNQKAKEATQEVDKEVTPEVKK